MLKPPHLENGMTVGLLGGSFNPPHSGHRDLSLHILQRLNIHQLWWLVSPGNPLKSKANLQSLEHRLELCKKLATHSKIKVTGFEAARPTVYTSHTLNFLQMQFPAIRFVWIMGADNLINFHKWKKWQQIFLNCPIVIHDRPGFRYQALSSQAAHYFEKNRIPEIQLKNIAFYKPPAWAFLSAPLNEASSTQIRKITADI